MNELMNHAAPRHTLEKTFASMQKAKIPFAVLHHNSRKRFLASLLIHRTYPCITQEKDPTILQPSILSGLIGGLSLEIIILGKPILEASEINAIIRHSKTIFPLDRRKKGRKRHILVGRNDVKLTRLTCGLNEITNSIKPITTTRMYLQRFHHENALALVDLGEISALMHEYNFSFFLENYFWNSNMMKPIVVYSYTSYV